MSLNVIVKAVADQLPPFNDKLLVGYSRDQVNKGPSYLEEVFKQAVLVLNDSRKKYPDALEVEYVGRRVRTPVEHVRYVFTQSLTKDRANINRDEIQLIEYTFSVNGTLFNIPIYLPYWVDDSMIVNGTIHNTQFVLCHKLVRIGDGVLIKVMRSPLHFFRSLRTTVVATNGEEHHAAIITTKAHFRTNSTDEHRGSKTLPPLLLYILAQYGFEETMRKFGFEEQISISQFQDTEDPVYSYYEIKPDIFVKVNTEAMNDIYFERVVGSLIYILNLSVGFIRDFDQLFTPNLDGSIFCIALGKILYGFDVSDTLAASHGASHIYSLRTYMDAKSKEDLEIMYHKRMDNIFDLFMFVFYNIDSWLANYSYNDLFERRIAGVDKLYETIVNKIFRNVYNIMDKKKLDQRKVYQALQSKLTMAMTSKLYQIEGISTANDAYNNDMFFTRLDKVWQDKTSKGKSSSNSNNLIRSKDHQFHPSMIAIESCASISTTRPGIAGKLNPYVQIDRTGAFDKDAMPWYDDFEKELSKYIVQA